MVGTGFYVDVGDKNLMDSDLLTFDHDLQTTIWSLSLVPKVGTCLARVHHELHGLSLLQCHLNEGQIASHIIPEFKPALPLEIQRVFCRNLGGSIASSKSFMYVQDLAREWRGLTERTPLLTNHKKRGKQATKWNISNKLVLKKAELYPQCLVSSSFVRYNWRRTKKNTNQAVSNGSKKSLHYGNYRMTQLFA